MQLAESVRFPADIKRPPGQTFARLDALVGKQMCARAHVRTDFNAESAPFELSPERREDDSVVIVTFLRIFGVKNLDHRSREGGREKFH